MTSPYDLKTKETRERLFPFNPYIPNKIYKQDNGLHVYKNTKGYIHILKPCKIKYDGEFSHYEICNYLFTKQNTIKEVSSFGTFSSKEQCLEAIENMRL